MTLSCSRPKKISCWSLDGHIFQNKESFDYASKLYRGVILAQVFSIKSAGFVAFRAVKQDIVVGSLLQQSGLPYRGK